MRIFLILILMLLIAAPGYAGVAYSPYFNLGIEANDNIDQASSEALSSTSYLVKTGFSANGYYNPDVFLKSSLDLSGWAFSNTAYGSLLHAKLSFGLDYDITDRLTAGIDTKAGMFTDSVLDENNNNITTVIPRVSYLVAPYTAVSVMQESSNITYPNSEEAITESKPGLYITQKLNDFMMLNAGAFNRTAVNQYFESLNESSSGGEVIFSYEFMPRNKLNLGYVSESILFPNWATDRTDNKSIASLGLSFRMEDDYCIIVDYVNIQNASTDDMRKFANNIASVSISWNPTYGSIYSDGSNRESEYFYNEAVSAVQREDWPYAEKLLRKAMLYLGPVDDAHFYLGYVLSKQKKYSEAIDELERAISLDNECLEAYYTLAYSYARLGEAEKTKKIKQMIENLQREENLEDIF